MSIQAAELCPRCPSPSRLLEGTDGDGICLLTCLCGYREVIARRPDPWPDTMVTYLSRDGRSRQRIGDRRSIATREFQARQQADVVRRLQAAHRQRNEGLRKSKRKKGRAA